MSTRDSDSNQNPSSARQSTTAFEHQKRGSFPIRFPNGKVLRFKDAYHRGLAWQAMAMRRFKDAGEMVAFAQRCPNGYSSFAAED